MFKGTPEIIAQRREEIVGACEKLYQTMNFKDITLKEIGREVSFSRPTIYRLAKAGRLEIVPLNGVNRIRLQSVVDCLSKGANVNGAVA